MSDQQGIANTRTIGASNPHGDGKRDYKTARFVAQIVAFVGWAGVGIGVLLLLFALRSQDFLSLLLALGVLFSGLLLVVGGQVSRAMVDTADYSRQMLQELRNQRLEG